MKLRPMRPGELDDVVELLTATSASDNRDQLRDGLTSDEPDAITYVVVAEVDGKLAGAGKISSRPTLPGTLSVAVAVDAAMRNRGIGTQLMDLVVARLAEIRDMKSATLSLRDDALEGRRFAERYGFEVSNHSVGMRLALDEPVEALAERAAGAARRAGVLTRVADPVSEAAVIKETAGRSVVGLPMPYGEQRRNTRTDRARIPASAVVILAYPPAEPDIAAGLTIVRPQAGSDEWHVLFTGVDPGYRRRGVAAALKTASHVEAVRAGARAVSTDNDESNEPILRLNHRLGMKPAVGYWGLVRRLR